MPTRPSAPTSSSWTSRMPLANSPPPCSSAAAQGERRGCRAPAAAPCASLAMPRSDAAAASRAARLRTFSKSACVRGRARGTCVGLVARPAPCRRLGVGAARAGGCSAAATCASAEGCLRPRASRRGAGVLAPGSSARLVGHRCWPRPRPRRRRRPPRPRPCVGRARRRRRTRRSADAACCCAWARSYIASETLWNAVCSARSWR